jgi:glycine dehydrogenase
MTVGPGLAACGLSFTKYPKLLFLTSATRAIINQCCATAFAMGWYQSRIRGVLFRDHVLRISLPCSFVPRHNSTTPEELDAMVKETGFESMDALIDATVPKAIRRTDGMDLGKYTDGMTESQFLDYFK